MSSALLLLGLMLQFGNIQAMMDLDDNKKIRDPLHSDQLGNDFISLLQTHRTITWKERFDLHSETGSRGRSIGSSLREHEIPIVTIDTHDPRTRFPVPGVGGRYYTNIGVGKTYSGSKTKTMLYKKWLQAKLQHEPDEIVILLDSSDVLFGGCSEEELYSAYKAIVSASGGAPVVMGAGLDLWPYTLNMPQRYSQATTVQRRRAVQQLLGLSDNSYGQHANLTLCSEYWYPCSWPPVYQYLNAGFTMGPVKAIYKVFAEMLNEPDAITGGWLTYISDKDGGFFHDQTAAAEWMLTHVDDITLDYTGALSIQIAKMNNPVSNKVLFMKDGMVHNNVTGLIQCFVHGNGPSEVFLPQLRTLVPVVSKEYTGDDQTFNNRCDSAGVDVGQLPSTGPYTIWAKIKPSQMGSKGIVGWGNYGTKNGCNALRLSNDGLAHYWWANDMTVQFNFADGSFHEVVSAWDGNTRKIWIDGEEKLSQSSSGLNAQGNNFCVGKTNRNEYFDGQIEFVRIYDSYLTPTSLTTSKMNFSHVAEMGDAHAKSPALLFVFTSVSVMMYIMILIMSVMMYIIFLGLGGNFCLWGASPFKNEWT